MMRRRGCECSTPLRCCRGRGEGKERGKERRKRRKSGLGGDLVRESTVREYYRERCYIVTVRERPLDQQVAQNTYTYTYTCTCSTNYDEQRGEGKP